jgi:hypothetical protein
LRARDRTTQGRGRPSGRRRDRPGQIPGWGQWLLEWADAAVWDRYHRQLAIARAALAAPERLDGLDPDMARRLADDCAELGEWLALRYGELAVGGPGIRER